MPQYLAAQPRRASDRRWAFIILALTASTVLVLFAVGWYMRHSESEAQTLRVQQRQYKTYLQATEPPPPSNPKLEVEAALSQAQQTRARLLSHPHVTPGPHFDKPGVQSTAIAIVDAIDHAQGRTFTKAEDL